MILGRFVSAENFASVFGASAPTAAMPDILRKSRRERMDIFLLIILNFVHARSNGLFACIRDSKNSSRIFFIIVASFSAISFNSYGSDSKS